MTQPDELLQILRGHATAGITADEIDRIRRIKQYNSRILDLREDGHIIISWRRPEPAGVPPYHRFYYAGRVVGGIFKWYAEPGSYPNEVQRRVETESCKVAMRQLKAAGAGPEQTQLLTA